MPPLTVKASSNVHSPPNPLKPTPELNIFPFMRIVLPRLDAWKVVPPCIAIFIAEEKIRDPYILSALEVGLEIVGVLVTPVHVISRQNALVIFIITVWPVMVKELASKKTLSSDVGKQFVGVPPVVSDQWLESSQLPEFPTQYKFLAAGEFIIQPLLLPLSIELFAIKLAPPVAEMSLNVTKDKFTKPGGWFIIDCPPKIFVLNLV